jgi:hypothetical protein
MVLSSGTAILLIIALTLLVSGGGSILLAVVARRTDSLLARIGIPFVSLFGLFAGIWMYAKTSSVYEISTREKNVYLVFGSTVFTTSDGQKIPVEYNSGENYLVNISDVPLYCELVGYGAGMSLGGESDPVEPHTFRMHPSAPDYYPWESPPSEVEASTGTTMVFKLWVHE